MKNRPLLLSVALVGCLASGGALAQGVCKSFQEAPMLAEKVATGELPGVEERLPAEPLVVAAAEVGSYGGVMKDLFTGSRLGDYRHYGYDPLVRWSPDGSEILPNIAKSWEVSADATAYTFHLREGMKWSDGHPFTAKDIQFWWDKVETNPDIMVKGPRNIFVVNGERAKVETLDDHTIRFSWSNPNGNFLLDLAGPYGQRVVQFPAHYIAQFDRNLNPEGVAGMMAEAGTEDYTSWWMGRVGTYGKKAEQNDPDRPTMLAWVTTEPFIGRQYFELSRNPYYFKVDADCNQLPYIDTRSYNLVPDPEVQLLKTMASEFDYSLPNISVPQNKGIFFENMERGNYRFAKAQSCDYNNMFIEMPFNHPDAFKAEFFQNKDVRVALSVAIDRQGIIDTVYLGQGMPYQSAARPTSPFYNEQLATQYTAYDPDQANEILDGIYPDKDSDGYRLGPDGKRISVSMIAENSFRAEWADVLQIIVQNWADIGIHLNAEAVGHEIYETRRLARDREMQVWAGENGCGQLPTVSLDRFLRYQGNWDNWIVWVSEHIAPQPFTIEGVEAVEPPAEIKRLFEIQAAMPTKAGAERDALMAEFMQTMADAFVNIGTVLPEGNYRVVSNRIGNVYEPITEGWLYPGPAPTNMESWFIKQ